MSAEVLLPADVFKVFLLPFLIAGVTVQGDGGCKVLTFLQCMKNKTFTGHMIKSFRLLAPGLEMCQHECFLEDRCVSYNLSPLLGAMRSCQLNDADNVTRPGHVVSKEGFEYCPIKNPCSSNPCPADRMCTPDFLWNTFSCDGGGWTTWTTWTTCQPHPTTCPRKRERTCSNPPPQNKGGQCIGSSSETKICANAENRDCEIPLGMEDKNINDFQITASSFYKSIPTLYPWQGRLRNPGILGITYGAWAAGSASRGEYLQVDLLCAKNISKIATQGRSLGMRQWVKQYTVSYTNDTNSWISYTDTTGTIQVFPGNIDKNTVVTNRFNPTIIAQYIRLIVQKWHYFPSLRMELYGCSLL